MVQGGPFRVCRGPGPGSCMELKTRESAPIVCKRSSCPRGERISSLPGGVPYVFRKYTRVHYLSIRGFRSDHKTNELLSFVVSLDSLRMVSWERPEYVSAASLGVPYVFKKYTRVHYLSIRGFRTDDKNERIIVLRGLPGLPPPVSQASQASPGVSPWSPGRSDRVVSPWSVVPFFNGVVLFWGPRRVPDGRQAGAVDGHPPYDESIPGHEGQVGRAPKIEVRERPHDVVVVYLRDQQRVLR